jgi:hypothetical protein
LESISVTYLLLFLHCGDRQEDGQKQRSSGVRKAKREAIFMRFLFLPRFT